LRIRIIEQCAACALPCFARLSRFDLRRWVADMADLDEIAQPLAADKKLEFKLELAPELPAGHGDGRRLTQVLINLVGNAIKFTDAGEVAIKAEVNNGAFYVSVRDTGPGISALPARGSNPYSLRNTLESD
jgi:signal transduction histidine kinase